MPALSIGPVEQALLLRNILVGALLTLSISIDSQAHLEEERLEEVLVTGRSQVLAGAARTASEGVIGQMDLAIRPLLRPGDTLEAIPGLIVTQHSGSGLPEPPVLTAFSRR